MKKKIGILALVLAISMCFFTIGAFAEGDNSSSQMPFVEADDISPEYPDIQTEADLIEDFEEMFGEGSGKLITITLVGFVFMALFIPCLITVIVFGVINGKTKKKIKEYERFFGSVPGNQPVYYNPDIYNNPYGSQPVNQTDVPMGTAPAGNSYIPQNSENIQQGGQF